MDIKLKHEIKDVTVISGFPGFGMVGTIATEFLIEHLKTEHFGRIILDKMPAVIAIHDGEIIEPFALYYNKEYNLLILHSIFGQPGTEWKIAEAINQLCQQISCKEIISLEGVGTNSDSEESKSFYFTSHPAQEAKFKELKIEKLNEGIIMGVTSALMLRNDNIPVSCLFAETHTNLPDSKAAAKLIQGLDQYLKLKIDETPLIEMAEKFEAKLKKILSESKMAESNRDKKAMSYVG